MPSSKETKIMIKQEGAETQTTEPICFTLVKNTIISFIKLIIVSILPGWFILFNIFGANLNIIREPLRLYMKLLLSVEIGAAFLGILSLIILINKIIFKLITYSESKNNVGCGQKFVALFCICITNISTTYVGYAILYDLGQLKLVTVEDKYINSVIITTSLITGWVIHICGTFIGFRMCFSKQHREVISKKLFKKVFNVESEYNNMVEVTATEIVDKKNKKIKMNTNSESTDEIKELDELP